MEVSFNGFDFTPLTPENFAEAIEITISVDLSPGYYIGSPAYAALVQRMSDQMHEVERVWRGHRAWIAYGDDFFLRWDLFPDSPEQREREAFVNSEVEAHMRGDKTKLPMVPFVNLSENPVRFEIGNSKFEVAPGESVDLPKGYTLWREGNRKPIVMELAPQLSPMRIECQVCGILIGQADSTGILVAWEHNAPCGLPCIGRGTDHMALDNMAGTHANVRSCTRCKPKTCPVCKGKPQSGHASPSASRVYAHQGFYTFVERPMIEVKYPGVVLALQRQRPARGPVPVARRERGVRCAAPASSEARTGVSSARIAVSWSARSTRWIRRRL
jgi:hypothetical protein